MPKKIKILISNESLVEAEIALYTRAKSAADAAKFYEEQAGGHPEDERLQKNAKYAKELADRLQKVVDEWNHAVSKGVFANE